MGPWELEEREKNFFWLVRECFPSTSGLAWLRGFASVPRDFSNSSNDLSERKLRPQRSVLRGQAKTPRVICY